MIAHFELDISSNMIPHNFCFCRLPVGYSCLLMRYWRSKSCDDSSGYRCRNAIISILRWHKISSGIFLSVSVWMVSSLHLSGSFRMIFAINTFMGELHPKTKLSNSHNDQHFLETNTCWSKLLEKLKNGIKILVGQVVLGLVIKQCFTCCDQ